MNATGPWEAVSPSMGFRGVAGVGLVARLVECWSENIVLGGLEFEGAQGAKD